MDRDNYYNRPKGCEHKTMIILIIVASFIILFSCEKLDETFCWTCTTISYTMSPQKGTLEIGYMDHEVCDYSELDAQKYENSHTMPWYFISSCGDRRKYECVCIKKQR